MKTPNGCNNVVVGVGPGTWEVGHISVSAGDSPYGLKDMAGNVWDWVQDYYSATYYQDYCASGCTDPLNTSSATYRVVRGGSFSDGASYLRVVRRGYVGPSGRYYFVGFRCSRTP